jgi:hypothetical protein
MLLVAALLIAALPVLAGGTGNSTEGMPVDQPGQIRGSDGPAPSEVVFGAPTANDPSGTLPAPGLRREPAVPGVAESEDLEWQLKANGPGRTEDLTPKGYGSPLVIPAADFRSDGIQPTYYNFWFATGAFQGANATTSGCLMAPAYLPNGATVIDVYASVYDNSTTYNVPISLKRVENYTGAVDTMASITSAGASTAIQSLVAPSISNPSVSYPNYSYYATACVRSSDTAVYSVRIYYTP